MNVLLAFLANSATNVVIGLLVAKYLGPEEYGRFAISLFDFRRGANGAVRLAGLAATRFYSVRVRDQKPVVRATLDMSFVAVVCALALATVLFAYLGPTLDFDGVLILLALLTAVVNGLFDYSTALVRARFDDHLFGRLVFVKNSAFVAPDRRRGVLVSFGGHRLGGHDREPPRHGDRGARLAD